MRSFAAMVPTVAVDRPLARTVDPFTTSGPRAQNRFHCAGLVVLVHDSQAVLEMVAESRKDQVREKEARLFAPRTGVCGVCRAFAI